MIRTATRACVILALCLALTACLPGKKKDEKVIAKAEQATQEVQVEKVSADMINAAQSLMARISVADPAELASVETTNTANLRTVRCADGETVMAFLPRTAAVAKNGVIPEDLAQRMRTNLQKTTHRDSVKDTQSIAACGADISVDTVAVNSPVLFLELANASVVDEMRGNNEIESVSMEQCADVDGRRVPGVVVVTKYKNNPDPVREPKCGEAAPSPDELPNIAITTEGAMPDWKKQLSGVEADKDATVNFSCIVKPGQDKCSPLNSIEQGVKVVCNNDQDNVDYVINPEFDQSTYQFKPSADRKDCGRGWSGQLVARIKQKSCYVVRDGQQQEPAAVYDIAYVGAKCSKDAVLLQDTCPAEATLPNGMMMADKNINMINSISLQPAPTSKRGQNASTISYYDTTPNGISTNTDADTQTLVAQSQQNVIQAESAQGTSTVNLFYSKSNVNTLTKQYDFDNAFTKELSDAGAATQTPVTCYGMAQSCMSGLTPVMYAVVVDRSGSMSAPTPELVQKQTVCRATMGNLFKKDEREQACKAAKTWQQITKDKVKTRNELLDRWDYTREPVGYGSYVYDQIVAEADSLTQQALNEQNNIMYNALTNKGTYERLQYALSIGQDCYPRGDKPNPLTGRIEVPVRDDLYGSCAPVFAKKDELTASDYTKAPLRDCQSSCPGICVTDAVQRVPAFKPDPVNNKIYPTSDNKPVAVPSTRMSTVDSFMQTNLVANLPAGTQLYYYEFIGGRTDDPNSGNVGNKPVDVALEDPNAPPPDPDQPKQQEDKTFWILKVAKEIKNKFNARGDYNSGGTPLYVSVDPGIDELRKKVFDVKTGPDPARIGPMAPTILAILTDGDDTGSTSKYFGKNFCNPEVEPLKFQCAKNERYCCKKVLGVCIKRCDRWSYLDAPADTIKKEKGADYPQARLEWCQARGFSEVQKVNKPGGAMVQHDSLVGFIGRNFPNTKVYYLDIGTGTTIGNVCGDIKKQVYPSPDAPLILQKKILNVFKYDDSAGNQIYKAFDAMVGGGRPTPEIGRLVCSWKYPPPAVVPFSDAIPDEAPLEFKAFDNQSLAQCEDPVVLDVDAPPGTVVVPPNYIPNPIIPPVNDPYGDPYGNCINGYDRYTMRFCGP